MKRIALAIFIIIPFITIHSQEDAKYLKGAVPEVVGKVIFTKIINTDNAYSGNQLFTKVNEWAVANYTKKESDNNNRVLLTDSLSGDIACNGETKLVFKKAALILDQAIMSYQLILDVNNSSCKATIRSIKFKYDTKEFVPAENMITDMIALNKKGDKLSRYYDKFRKHAVDSVNAIFNSLEKYLNNQVTNTPTVQSNNAVVSTEQVPSYYAEEIKYDASLPGFRKVNAEKISVNIIKLLENECSLISSGASKNISTSTLLWGGLGRFANKPVVYSFIDSNSNTIQTLDANETFTVSFYTDAYKDVVDHIGKGHETTNNLKLTSITTSSGAPAFAEAWMIIECKKLSAQPISLNNGNVKANNTDRNKNERLNMYIGEILNVWIK